MAVVFILAGILAILYFPILCVDSRRWNPTFSSFWIVFGVLCILAGIICQKDQNIQEILALISTLLLIFFLYTERKILMAVQKKHPEELDYLIVLGARVNGTTPSAALQKRLNRAARYLRKNPGTQVIVSGGQGPGELLSESEAMKKVLIQNGIEADRILMEDRSTTTEENLLFSGRMIDISQARVGIVTNDFHIYRSLCLARELGYRRCYGIPADSEAISLLNYLVREFFAVIKEFLYQRRRKKHYH